MAHIWQFVSARLGRKVVWYEMISTGGEIDWKSIRQVFAVTKKRLFSGRVLIARIGSESGKAQLWVGISGANEPRRAAETLAKAVGARLSREGHPPIVLKHGMLWRIGYCETPPREADASNARERSLDEQLTPEVPAFPDICDEYLDADDTFLIICQGGTKPTRIRIMVLTTIRGLDTSITDAAEVRRSFISPTYGAFGAVVALGAVYGLPYLSQKIEHTFLWWVAAVPITIWAVWFLWHALAKPPPLVALRKGLVPRYIKAAKKGGQLPVWQLGEWAAGSSLTGTHSPMRPAPTEAKVVAGARLGTDPNGDECWLPYGDRYRGVIAYGDPGTGKTTFLLNLLRADAKKRAKGDPLTIIWIESKGEGANRAVKVMNDVELPPLVVSGSSTKTPRLELIDRANPSGSARLLTEAMRYAYSVGDIYEQSAEALTAAFEAAIVFTPEAAAELGLPLAQPNIIEVAFRLVGGIPEQHSKAKRVLRETVAEEHRQTLERYFQESARDFTNRIEPIRNKLAGLRAATGLFQPTHQGQPRSQISFERVLDTAQPLVINLGAPVDDPNTTYTETIGQRTAAMAMFMLWETIKRHCESWQQHNRLTSIYSDELRDISGFGDHTLEVVRALADQGRSRGVLPTFGTQRPDQLIDATRLAVNSFGTQAYFSLRATEAAEAASENLKGSYSPSEITALAKFHCAASITHTGFVPAAFTLLPDNL